MIRLKIKQCTDAEKFILWHQSQYKMGLRYAKEYFEKLPETFTIDHPHLVSFQKIVSDYCIYDLEVFDAVEEERLADEEYKRKKAKALAWYESQSDEVKEMIRFLKPFGTKG